MSRFLWRSLGGLVMTLGLVGPLHAAEPKLEAGLIYRFVQFSQWPAREPWTYCVAGDELVQQALQQLLGHTTEVRLIHTQVQAKPCHVLYLGREVTPDASWRPLLSNPQLLSIAANAELYQLGTVFGLIQEPRQLAFRVNLSLARSQGYQLNARMLRLAKEIY